MVKLNDFKVAFYTSAYFLDEALETIQALKSRVSLDVYIEVSEYSKKSTILNLGSISHLDLIEDPQCVLGNVQWEYYKPYFEGVGMVRFIVKKNKSLSFQSFISFFKIGKWLGSQSYNVIYFDNLTESMIGILPYIMKCKKCLFIHDTVSHLGEFNIVHLLLKKIYLSRFDSLYFFSNYSATLFEKTYHTKKSIVRIPLQPYTFLSQFSTEKEFSRDSILFFGRISQYKGVDLLLQAIPRVLTHFPNQRFIIAGKSMPNAVIDFTTISNFLPNITLYDYFIETSELVQLLESSKFVVCPYREASQSGVLMSCFAMGRTVVASNVGAFPEYIVDHYNGLLCEPDSNDLANKIIEALNDNYYLTLEKNIQTYSNAEIINNISDAICQSFT